MFTKSLLKKSSVHSLISAGLLATSLLWWIQKAESSGPLLNLGTSEVVFAPVEKPPANDGQIEVGKGLGIVIPAINADFRKHRPIYVASHE